VAATAAIARDVDLLGAQHVFVHRARRRQGLGLLGALPSRAGTPTRWCVEANQGAATEVRDQEAHRARSDHRRELVGDHLDRIGRRGRFDPLEQRAKIGSRRIVIAHGLNHRVSPRALPGATGAGAAPRSAEGSFTCLESPDADFRSPIVVSP
jgi:hypothetical protein